MRWTDRFGVLRCDRTERTDKPGAVTVILGGGGHPSGIIGPHANVVMLSRSAGSFFLSVEVRKEEELVGP